MSADSFQAAEAVAWITVLVEEAERLHEPGCQCSARSDLGKYRCIPSQLAGWLRRIVVEGAA